MSDHLLLATFAYEDDLLAATTEARRRDLQIVDAFTPYAVHGLDRAMGLRPSRLTWVCFVCAMVGALGMFGFQHWVAAVSWPINVGGKPWNSLPSDVPVAFESAVLLGAFGSVFALFGVCRLFPGRQARPLVDRATDDRFVLVLHERDASQGIADIEAILAPFHLISLEERVLPAGGTP